ncbi:Uncharacterised protein [Mycobacteroides abscessus subsp. massiliense]|nr:Uncharacterised protein [Mycobacteroides abscessus subsp. massiliense]
MRQVLGHGLAGDGQAIAVQQAGIQERAHHHGHPPDLVDILHHVAAKGFDVRQMRHLIADASEVGQRQFDLGLFGDGQQMQHRVGGATERHHHGDGVLEGLLGEDVARGDPAAQHLNDGLAGLACVLLAALVDGDRRGAARQGHSQRLGGAGHGVGGVHAAAGALTRTDGAFDDVDVLA